MSGVVEFETTSGPEIAELLRLVESEINERVSKISEAYDRWSWRKGQADVAEKLEQAERMVRDLLMSPIRDLYRKLVTEVEEGCQEAEGSG